MNSFIVLVVQSNNRELHRNANGSKELGYSTAAHAPTRLPPWPCVVVLKPCELSSCCRGCYSAHRYSSVPAISCCSEGLWLWPRSASVWSVEAKLLYADKLAPGQPLPPRTQASGLSRAGRGVQSTQDRLLSAFIGGGGGNIQLTSKKPASLASAMSHLQLLQTQLHTPTYF